jgi:large subunit ribosomal protein L15
MRMGKQPGSTSKDAMPIGPFRTQTQPVNLRDLDRFDDGAEVTPETLRERGLIKSTSIDVKILGDGELKKKLSVTAHRFSKTAREKIEAAGGSVTALRDDTAKKKKRTKKAKGPQQEQQPSEAAAEPETSAPDAPESEG